VKKSGKVEKKKKEEPKEEPKNAIKKRERVGKEGEREKQEKYVLGK
tara:strand:+ start:139 stop:276 length:138 start_codon:yes stop_codon:yes gene_type:complete